MDVTRIGLRRRMTLPPPIAIRAPYATDALGQQASPINSDLAAWEMPFLCQTAHAARGDYICIYEQRSTPGQGQRLRKLSETPPASVNSMMPYPCVVVQMGGSTHRWIVLNPQECEALYDAVKGVFPDDAIALASLREREGYSTFFGAYKSYACHAMPACMIAGGQFERSLFSYASQQTTDESAWRHVCYYEDATTPLLPLSARSPKASYAPAQTPSSRSSHASVQTISRKTSWASLRSVFQHSPTSSLSASDSWETASQASRKSATTPAIMSLESSALPPARTQAVSPASIRLRRAASSEHPLGAALGRAPHVACAPDARASVVLPHAPARSYLPPFLRRRTKAASHDLFFFDNNPQEMPHE